MSKETTIPDAEFKEIVIGTYGPMLEAILKEFKTVKSNQQVLSKQIDSVQTTADTIKRGNAICYMAGCSRLIQPVRGR